MSGRLHFAVVQVAPFSFMLLILTAHVYLTVSTREQITSAFTAGATCTPV